jgi:hypothetical protein
MRELLTWLLNLLLLVSIGVAVTGFDVWAFTHLAVLQ